MPFCLHRRMTGYTEFGLVALGKGQATDVTSPVESAAIAFQFEVMMKDCWVAWGACTAAPRLSSN